MIRDLRVTQKSFWIICLYILIGENYLYCRVIPEIDRHPQKKISFRPKEWKYNDGLSEEIRTYHRETGKWYGVKHAVLSCQRDILLKYDEKARRILRESGGWISSVFIKFNTLEKAKNRTLNACSKAFQILPGSSGKMRSQHWEWKYNDTLSLEIRKYDGIKNKWINEKEAIAQCQKQAEFNYESRRVRYHLQNDMQGLQDIKDLKERSIKACKRAFEKAEN